MSETIEFEAEAFRVNQGTDDKSWIGLRSIDGHMMLFDNALGGGRFKVTMTPVEPALKPCPRCGGEMVMGTGVHTHVPQCKKCGATGPVRYSRAEAIAAHNARKCPELDPCPHCGEEWRLDRSKKLYSARCGGCDHRTKWHRTIYDLAADVNRRPQ